MARAIRYHYKKLFGYSSQTITSYIPSIFPRACAWRVSVTPLYLPNTSARPVSVLILRPAVVGRYKSCGRRLREGEN